MKVVINTCFGGFSVTKDVYDELGLKWDKYGYLENEDFNIDSHDYNAYRSDQRLIAAIEKIGAKEASGSMASLRIVEIPDGVEWKIDNYDGNEHVAEKHRTWR